MRFNLPPQTAAELAQGIYVVNEGDKTAIAAFLRRPVFSRNNSKVLTAEVGGRVLRAAKDAFGLCAMGNGDHSPELFLVFRGTTEENNKADFLTDARIGLTRSNSGWPVHIGFSHAFTSMKYDIQEFIQDCRKQNIAINKVHCIGHSLGGAVATLAAEWAYNNVSKNVHLYTFGQPRVGLTLFSTILTQKIGKDNIHRVFHTTDPVPMVPVFPYVHSPLPGLGHRISSDQLITTGEAHKMSNYLPSVEGKDWADLERAAPVFNHEHAIKEWLNSNRNQNPNCPKTFEWLEKAIVWILSKVLAQVVNVAQLALMGIHTFVDKLAWAIAKGIELKNTASKYLELFINKVMRILGMGAQQKAKQTTQSFLRYLLNELIKRANRLATQAIQGITRR